MNFASANNLASTFPLLGENANAASSLANAFGFGGEMFSGGMTFPKLAGEIKFEDVLDSEPQLSPLEAPPEVPLLYRPSMEDFQESPTDSPLTWMVTVEAPELEQEENYETSILQSQLIVESNTVNDLQQSHHSDPANANLVSMNAANTKATFAAASLAVAATTHDTSQSNTTPHDVSTLNEVSIAQAASPQIREEDQRRSNAPQQTSQTLSDFVLAESTHAGSHKEAVLSEPDDSSNLFESAVLSKPESNASEETYSPLFADVSTGENSPEPTSSTLIETSIPTSPLESNERFAAKSKVEFEVTKVVTDNLVQQVQLTEEGESKQLRLQLHPAELGQVTLQVDWENDSLKVKLLANEMAANEILNQNRAELVTALAEEGIDFDSLEISYERENSDFSQEQTNDEPSPHTIPPELFATPSSAQTGPLRQRSSATVDITI